MPGDGARWPSFSTAVNVAAFEASLAPTLHLEVASWAEMPGETPTQTLARRELDEPQTFEALLTAVHRAYYTAPRVLDAVRALADSGPREPSRHFDAALVVPVTTTERGQRRL